MTITAGIDIGTGAVKTVLFRVEGDKTEWLAKRNDRIRQRDPFKLAEEAYHALLEEAGLKAPATWITSPPPARARASTSTPATSTP
jgi:benzoyl-CoA reductase subunit D